nr:hypothetical protein [Bacteroidota bacterium]
MKRIIIISVLSLIFIMLRQVTGQTDPTSKITQPENHSVVNQNIPANTDSTGNTMEELISKTGKGLVKRPDGVFELISVYKIFWTLILILFGYLFL